MADRAYTDAELDAAIAALSEPGRLQAAHDLVARAAPALHRVLDEAIGQGGWFDSGQEQVLREVAGEEDPGVRAEAVRTLVAEEARLCMFVGVTVGFELARELGHTSGPEFAPPLTGTEETPSAPPTEPPPTSPPTEPPPTSPPTQPVPTSPPGESPPTRPLPTSPAGESPPTQPVPTSRPGESPPTQPPTNEED